MREVLTEADSRSYQTIWKQYKSRFSTTMIIMETFAAASMVADIFDAARGGHA
jgi:hypothetical protein